MNLVLIGYRCTGKTTVGRILAEKLEWPLVDTDTLVQQRAGRSIKEIVAEGGWPEFRRIEREVVADVSAADRQIISAGGGAILDDANTRALRAGGKVVLLTCAPETIWERMKADPKTLAERPDLTDSGGIAEIRDLLDQRRDKYDAACHYRIQTDRFAPDEAAGRILAHLKAAGDV
ncbi:MAG TPA: shikimate kinase [Phycisphaerae bacterium]|nr:shikimate kinase [Phycisphaerae bacterium]